MVLFDVFAPQSSQRSRPTFTQKEKELHYKGSGREVQRVRKEVRDEGSRGGPHQSLLQGGGERGHNLQLLCHSCNSIKGNGTQAQLKKRLAEKGHIKGGATAVKAKTATAAKKPVKRRRLRGRGSPPVPRPSSICSTT